VNEPESTANGHVDEMTLLLYVERQLDRERAQEVSLHTQTCTRCLTMLHALDRESRLLTRAMYEEDEPLPARLAEFRVAVKRSMQWIWGVVFGLAVLGVYALYTGYIEPWEQQLDQAGFGSTNMLSLLVFQGAFWKGWQSMFTLFEFVALAALGGFALFAVRKYIRRGSALAVMFASLGLVAALATTASATEFRKDQTVQVKKDETIKGDAYLMGESVRVDGTIDGDLYAFTQQLEFTGHVLGDIICFCRSARIAGQVDGNVRDASNNLTITGSVERNVTAFNELFNLESGGRIGRSLTVFGSSVTLDGKLDRDFLGFFGQATIAGSIGGEMQAKGDSLTIDSSASIAGKAKFEGGKPAQVSSEAKLASPLEFKQREHKSHAQRGGGYYIWRLIWTAAYVLFGIVLFALLPSFSKETVELGEQYGASFGLGVLVLFGVPIAAIIACVTIIGLFVGLSTLLLWLVLLWAADIVVGTIVGQWLMGRSTEYWPMVLRMVVGVVIVRAITSIPFIGGWASFVVVLWGVGAIALALYRRLQPVIAPNIPSVPMGPAVPIGSPLPPNTTVGGMQSA
jgi:cytoskeletal protein CcmA (bactofilin family)